MHSRILEHCSLAPGSSNCRHTFEAPVQMVPQNLLLPIPVSREHPWRMWPRLMQMLFQRTRSIDLTCSLLQGRFTRIRSLSKMTWRLKRFVSWISEFTNQWNAVNSETVHSDHASHQRNRVEIPRRVQNGRDRDRENAAHGRGYGENGRIQWADEGTCRYVWRMPPPLVTIGISHAYDMHSVKINIQSNRIIMLANPALTSQIESTLAMFEMEDVWNHRRLDKCILGKIQSRQLILCVLCSLCTRCISALKAIVDTRQNASPFILCLSWPSCPSSAIDGLSGERKMSVNQRSEKHCASLLTDLLHSNTSFSVCLYCDRPRSSSAAMTSSAVSVDLDCWFACSCAIAVKYMMNTTAMEGE